MYLTGVERVPRILLRVLPLLLAIGVSGNLAKTVDGKGQLGGIECSRVGSLQREPRCASSTVEKSNDDLEERDDRPSKAAIGTARIFNGKPSGRGSWPWQVSLQLLHPKHGFIGHWCGGVLIEPTWVITAAHCIHNDLFNLPIGALWTAVLGEWELESNNRRTVRIPVERIFLHERFNNYVNDIALMKLSRDAPLSKTIKTIFLPEEDSVDNTNQEQNCVTSGWGRSGPSPSLSNALLEANVPLLKLKDCQRAYGNVVPIGPGHLCAGYTDGSSGSCVGDSGGPLQCQRDDGSWQLTGITSFGSGCARPGFPDVYTSLGYYLDWVKTTIASSGDFNIT